MTIMTRWVNSEKIDIVDNGVDTTYFTPSKLKPKPFSLVFTGSLDLRPNVDAVLYFLNDIWPLVLIDNPEATFKIVGRRPSEELRKMSF